VGYRLPHEARFFVADPPGLEPRLTDSESAVLPVTPRVIGRRWFGTCGGIRTPCARGRSIYGRPRLTGRATSQTTLPEQDSNLQSRINGPLVYRLTDRGLRYLCASGLRLPIWLFRSASAISLRGQDLNLRLPGYEPGGLPNCPTAQRVWRAPGKSRTPDNLLVRQGLSR
jgi:hypothetical protein